MKNDSLHKTFLDGKLKELNKANQVFFYQKRKEKNLPLNSKGKESTPVSGTLN